MMPRPTPLRLAAVCSLVALVAAGCWLLAQRRSAPPGLAPGAGWAAPPPGPPLPVELVALEVTPPGGGPVDIRDGEYAGPLDAVLPLRVAFRVEGPDLRRRGVRHYQGLADLLDRSDPEVPQGVPWERTLLTFDPDGDLWVAEDTLRLPNEPVAGLSLDLKIMAGLRPGQDAETTFKDVAEVTATAE